MPARPSRPARPRSRSSQAPRHPYTRALLACHPDRADSLRRHSGHGAVAAGAAGRLPLRAALRRRAAGLPRAARPPRAVRRRALAVRCVQYRMSAADPVECATCRCCSAAGSGFLRKTVPPMQAVSGVSLDLHEGEILGARRRIAAAARPRSAAPSSACSARPRARSCSTARASAACRPTRRAARATRSSTCIRTPAPRSIRGGASAARWQKGC